MKIPFMKMSGSGNDFILIDHRKPIFQREHMKEFVQKVCRRRISVGADGLIFIEPSEKADFKWQFFNADGSEAEMCGNGGRCAARFAYLKGIAGSSLTFETIAGVLSAEVDGKRVKLELTRPHGLKLDENLVVEGKPLRVSSINTGVPHAVHFVDDVEQWDVVRMGRAIRNHSHFAPSGTNANFVQIGKDSHLAVRTYERGVEDETLACGTGATASAVVAHLLKKVEPPVAVTTRSGEILTIHFQSRDGVLTDVFLEGDVTPVFEGKLTG